MCILVPRGAAAERHKDRGVRVIDELSHLRRQQGGIAHVMSCMSADENEQLMHVVGPTTGGRRARKMLSLHGTWPIALCLVAPTSRKGLPTMQLGKRRTSYSSFELPPMYSCSHGAKLANCAAEQARSGSGGDMQPTPLWA